ncbi:MAG: divergent polysaccharide deacetylase family protein [Acidobacteriia bacterium]|nr:divergent polysaccharide deacetylase family protein [Terriglobia bacterium]
MTRGSNRLEQPSSEKPILKYFLFCILAGALLVAGGCKKKSAPLPAAAIRGITREFVLAARNASEGRAEVGMRPEYAARQPGKAQVLLADRIYVTIPMTKAGQADRAAREAIEREFARVAEYHHMMRVERPGAPGLERFDYLAQGRRTQSIHLITPLVSAAAASVTSTSRNPRLAVVIDDLGSDPAQADALFHLSYRLTLSVLPHHSNSTEIAEEAHRRGYQVMLHLPVASTAGKLEEPVELHPGMDSGAVQNTFASMLETVPYASGVNNHEGSLGTSDEKLMDELMPLLRQDKLFFIDSRTTTATVAESAARAAGVLAARRNVFLDDEQTVGAIRKQFVLAIHDAREKGSALAIGHPHPETLQVLGEMLPEAEREGVTLVFASDLVR